MARELKELNQPLGEALTVMARRLFGRATAASIEQATFAVVDLPFAAIRRHLAAGSALPAELRTQLEAAVRAVLKVRKP
jgi:hypothetical protein